jgi:hypothetical protein
MQERRNTRTEKTEIQNTFTIRMLELWSKNTETRKEQQFQGDLKKSAGIKEERKRRKRGTKAAERTTKGKCKRRGEAEQAQEREREREREREGERERERGKRKTKSSYVSRDKNSHRRETKFSMFPSFPLNVELWDQHSDLLGFFIEYYCSKPSNEH